MRILERFTKNDRKFWYVCYACMMHTDHNAEKSVFYSEAPPVVILGRPWGQCPRCGGTNTKSFQQLKDEGSDSVLWGLEQLVRKRPRSYFEVKAEQGAAVGESRTT